MDTLSVGEHTIKVTFTDGCEATTTFVVTKVPTEIDNLKIADNFAFYVKMSVISIVGIVSISLLIHKKSKLTIN